MPISPELLQWAPFVVMVVIFYFMLYRPQKKQQNKREEMLRNLKKGDKVLTVGGMFGTITAFSGDSVTLKVAEKVEIDFSRSAVNQVLNTKEEK